MYGLILYSAIVAASSTDESDAVYVTVFSVISVVVFWGAHVFSRTISEHGVHRGVEVPLGRAVRLAFAESAGMLYSIILPTLPLLLAVFHVTTTDDAVSLSLLIAMVILGVLGYQSFAARGAHPAVRVLGALGTAFFGFLVIVLNTLVH